MKMMMMKQWIKTKKKTKNIKDKNDILDEIIGKSKSFEQQIKSFKKVKSLKGYQHSIDYAYKE